VKEKWNELKKNADFLIGGRYNRFIVGFVLSLIALWMLSRQLNFIISPILSLFELVVMPAVFSVILYYIFNPIIDWLESRKISRGIGIFLLFFALFAIFVGLSVMLLPTISHQITMFIKHLPSEINDWKDQLQQLLDEPFWHGIRDSINEQLSQVNDYLSKYGGKLSFQALHGLGDFAQFISKALLGAVLIPFMLFFLLKDRGKILPSIVSLLPINWRVPTREIGIEIHNKLSSYFRAQLIMAVGVTILLMISLKIVGVKYSLTLAIATGILNFLVPSFGAALGAVPTVLIALMDSPWQVFWVVLIYYVIQHTESHLVAPILLGNKLAIHPLTILVLLIWSGEIYGFVGLIIIIPLYVIIKVAATYFFELYKEISEHY